MNKTFLKTGACFVFVLLYLNTYAQYDETFATQSIGLGNQNATVNHSFNPVGNPALMNENKKTNISLVVMNKYFISSLRQGALGIAKRVSKSDACGLVIQFNGTPNLKQTAIAFAYSKKINEKFNAGISVIYLNIFEQTIGTGNNILGKVGVTFKPSKSVLVGTTVFNPFLVRSHNFSKERIPTYISAGISYKVSSQVNVFSEYKLGLNEVHHFKFGLNYAPKEQFIIFAGFQNSNSPLSFSFTFKTKTIDVNIAMQYHQVLGFSPASGFDYRKD